MVAMQDNFGATQRSVANLGKHGNFRSGSQKPPSSILDNIWETGRRISIPLGFEDLSSILDDVQDTCTRPRGAESRSPGGEHSAGGAGGAARARRRGVCPRAP